MVKKIDRRTAIQVGAGVAVATAASGVLSHEALAKVASTTTRSTTLAAALSLQLPVPASFQIVSGAQSPQGSDLVLAGDANQNAIVDAYTQGQAVPATQQWILLGDPTVSNPYGGFAFVLVNLGYSVPLVLHAQQYPNLVILPEGQEPAEILWRLQNQGAINWINDNGDPLTIQGGGGWDTGSRAQLWTWNNASNQHWSFRTVSS